MPQTKLRNRSWVCLVWADGTFQLLNAPQTLLYGGSITHQGLWPLFVYGSKHNPEWLKDEGRLLVDPFKGNYIEVEPFIEEIVQDLVLPRTHGLHITNCARNLK